MSLPTPYVFMRRFLKAAQSDKKLDLLSFFIIELCLVEYEMLCFPPSLLAAAAVFTAQSTLSGIKGQEPGGLPVCTRSTVLPNTATLQKSSLLSFFSSLMNTDGDDEQHKLPLPVLLPTLVVDGFDDVSKLFKFLVSISFYNADFILQTPPFYFWYRKIVKKARP